MAFGAASYPVTMSVELGDLQVDFLMNPSELTPISISQSPAHMHTKHEFQFIFSGHMQVRIDEDYALAVPSDSVLLIPPNVLHANDGGPGERIIATIALQPLHREQGAQQFSEFRYYCELFGRVQAPLVLHSEAVSACVRQLTQLPEMPQSGHRRSNLLSYLFIQLGMAIEESCGAQQQQNLLQLGNRYNHQYYVIEQHINKNYNKKASTEEIAQALHMSRRQVDRIVDQIWGKTFATLILERRMLIAQKLLQKTNMPCVKVAEKVGYTSYPGFYLAFRRHFGMTPEEMRQKII